MVFWIKDIFVKVGQGKIKPEVFRFATEWTTQWSWTLSYIESICCTMFKILDTNTSITYMEHFIGMRKIYNFVTVLWRILLWEPILSDEALHYYVLLFGGLRWDLYQYCFVPTISFHTKDMLPLCVSVLIWCWCVIHIWHSVYLKNACIFALYHWNNIEKLHVPINN